MTIDVPSKPFVSKSHPVLRSGVEANGQNQLIIYVKGKLSGFKCRRVQTDIDTSSHPLPDIGKNSNIVRELLLLDSNSDTSWTIEVAAQNTSSSNKSLMPLDLPRFNGCYVEYE